jgi:hypothetical protein
MRFACVELENSRAFLCNRICSGIPCATNVRAKVAPTYSLFAGQRSDCTINCTDKRRPTLTTISRLVLFHLSFAVSGDYIVKATALRS